MMVAMDVPLHSHCCPHCAAVWLFQATPCHHLTTDTAMEMRMYVALCHITVTYLRKLHPEIIISNQSINQLVYLYGS